MFSIKIILFSIKIILFSIKIISFLVCISEHICSIISSMLRNCQGTQRQRLINKFQENDYEKVSQRGLFCFWFVLLLKQYSTNIKTVKLLPVRSFIFGSKQLHSMLMGPSMKTDQLFVFPEGGLNLNTSLEYRKVTLCWRLCHGMRN